MDKRDLSDAFRGRLKLLLARSGLNQSRFAAEIGIDRSALSQLLSGQSARLPRVETLLNVGERHSVSLDWLLGVSQDEGLASEMRESLEIEESTGPIEHTLLAQWHAEASGTKIRYVPTGIPDLLRTDAVIEYEANIARKSSETQISEKNYRLGYNRRPETDMEVCMPYHVLEIFARGNGIWSGLPARARREQLDHMARLVDDLYPSFRLYLYDGRQRYSIPYTIFGQMRAAIYVGDMYLVLNAVQPIQRLTRHFDALIRAAQVHAHETAAHCLEIRENVLPD